MSRKQKAASWTVAVAAICGLLSSALQYWTNRDDEHAGATATVSAIEAERWRAHDREHDTAQYVDVRRFGQVRDIYRGLDNLRAAIESCRVQIALMSVGRKVAARKEADRTRPLTEIMPKAPEPMRASIPRMKISDLEIELDDEQLEQATQELYK